jgi:hypothetical protein
MQNLGKLKNSLAIIGVIVVAFLVMRSIYDYHAAVIASLEKQRAEIKQVGALIQTWSGLNTDMFHYKQSTTHKDEVELKQFVESCAQIRHINITKLTPSKENKKYYQVAKIDLSILIPSFMSLVEFIRDLEAKKVNIVTLRIQKSMQNDQREVSVGLTAYLQNTEETK